MLYSGEYLQNNWNRLQVRVCTQGVASVLLWQASLLVAYDGMSVFGVVYCVEWSSVSRCAGWCASK